MPTYSFKNKDTGEEFTEFLHMSQVDDYLKDNPHIEQLVTCAFISYHDLKKPHDGFRDRLKDIKSAHYGSNIDTM